MDVGKGSSQSTHTKLGASVIPIVTHGKAWCMNVFEYDGTGSAQSVVSQPSVSAHQPMYRRRNVSNQFVCLDAIRLQVLPAQKVSPCQQLMYGVALAR